MRTLRSIHRAQLFILVCLTISIPPFLSAGIGNKNISSSSHLPYSPNELLIQFKSEFKFDHSSSTKSVIKTGSPLLDSLNSFFQIKEIIPLISDRQLALTKSEQQGLARTYLFKFSKNSDAAIAIKSYRSLDIIKLVEFNYYYFADDSKIKIQPLFNQIQLKEATAFINHHQSILIGVIDTGIDWKRKRLLSNIWSNPLEKIDGKDNDENGLIDDVWGYNFVDRDLLNQFGKNWESQPADYSGHGTQVAEIINQISNYQAPGTKDVTRNQLMILKAGARSPEGTIIFTTLSVAQAILYAVNHQAKIINLSLGSEFSSQILQQAIRYAIKNGCSVVASAGNENSSAPHYPASFENVWAVAATDTSDKKLTSSNYGNWIDFVAPAFYSSASSVSNIITSEFAGTSIAAAYVSGLAGLLLSCTNKMDSDSLMRTIVWSCENIYSKNSDYAGQLGSGRINAFRALRTQYQPNIILKKFVCNPRDSAQYLKPGDVIPVVATLKNLSSTANDIRLKLTTNDSAVNMVESKLQLPTLPYLKEYCNAQNPFAFTIKEGYHIDHPILFTANLETANGFSLTQNFMLRIEMNPSISLSIMSEQPLTLKWASNRKFFGYHLYRKNVNQPMFERLTESPIFDSTYIDQSIDFENDYFYYVTGIDSTNNESLPSDTLAIKTTENSQPLFFPTKNLATKLRIKAASPKSDTTLRAGDSLQLHIILEKNNDDTIRYRWFLNEKILAPEKDSTISVVADSLPGKVNVIKVVIAAKDTVLSHLWTIRFGEANFHFIFTPKSDTTIYENDSLKLKIEIPSSDEPGRKFAWFVNGIRDSAITKLDYLLRPDYFSAGIDTIISKYKIGDSTYSHRWLVKILNRNRAPKILSHTSLSDSALFSNDTLRFFVHAIDPDQDSLTYQWTINKKLDSTRRDSVFPFFGMRSELKSDTIFVKISDGDTSISHFWILHPKQKNQAPQIIHCIPAIDTTLSQVDSLIFRIHCTDPDGDSLKFAWFLNSQLDTMHHDSTYFYHANFKSPSNDTVVVTIADPDTAIKIQWILGTENGAENAIQSLYRWFPEQDSLIADGDSLRFAVYHVPNSSPIQWAVNQQIDATATDSIFTFHLSKRSSAVDTIQATIFRRNTVIVHEWFIHYLKSLAPKNPYRFVFKPEATSIAHPSHDRLNFSVQVIEGNFEELNFLWQINNRPDTTAIDSSFSYLPDPLATKSDTIKLTIVSSDSNFSHQWIVQLNPIGMLPAPKMLFPIRGENISEEDRLTWENDSSLVRINPAGSWRYLVQFAKDSTFLDLVSTDSCRATNLALNKILGFNRLLIGKPIYWRIKLISNLNQVSEFRKSRIPFYFYPLFVKLENFYAQTMEDGSIELFWTASYDKNCAGFNIYRSESTNNNFTKINEQLITGSTNYAFQDMSTQAGVTYNYKIEDVSLNGRKKFHQTISVTAPTPENYSLSQNYPNPFNSITSFKYEIPLATRVTVEVYNVLGRKVKTLVDEIKEPGFYIVYWNGIDDEGKSLVSGVYFYHMSTAKFNMTHKMIVVR